MCCLHCVSALFQRSGYALILAIEDQIDDQASRKAANTDRICQQTGPKHQAAANAKNKNNAHNGIALPLQKTDCTSAQTHNSDQRCKYRPCNMDRRSDQQDARIRCKNERSDKSAKRKAYAETERSITIASYILQGSKLGSSPFSPHLRYGHSQNEIEILLHIPL